MGDRGPRRVRREGRPVHTRQRADDGSIGVDRAEGQRRPPSEDHLGDGMTTVDIGYETEFILASLEKKDGRNRQWLRGICSECGQERWLLRSGRCRSCITKAHQPKGLAHYSRHDGRPETRGPYESCSYIWERIAPDDPLRVMAEGQRCWVLQHRLVMARHIGRPLRRDEKVTHGLRGKTCNEIENLQLRTVRVN